MENKYKSKGRDLTISDSFFTTKSPQETVLLGLKFARSLKPGITVFLKGDLGSGKTTFVKGMMKGFGVKRLVRSSSFILVSQYRSRKFRINHIDLYRLRGNREFENLGLEEYLSGDSVCIIEWADRLRSASVPHDFDISFKWTGERSREISVKKRQPR